MKRKKFNKKNKTLFQQPILSTQWTINSASALILLINGVRYSRQIIGERQL
jgi:hypothetical protein